MVWIIAIIAILGNLYLFGGYDVEGDLAVFMVGVALIADAFVVYSIITRRILALFKMHCCSSK